jgi:hypothetical protein
VPAADCARPRGHGRGGCCGLGRYARGAWRLGGVDVAASVRAVPLPIIVADVDANKLALAAELGATHCLDASQDNVVEVVNAICDGGVDWALEAIGLSQTVEQAIECVRTGGSRGDGAGEAGDDLLSSQQRTCAGREADPRKPLWLGESAGRRAADPASLRIRPTNGEPDHPASRGSEGDV